MGKRSGRKGHDGDSSLNSRLSVVLGAKGGHPRIEGWKGRKEGSGRRCAGWLALPLGSLTFYPSRQAPFGVGLVRANHSVISFR